MSIEVGSPKKSNGQDIGYIDITEVSGSANGAGQFDVTAINVSQYAHISIHRTGTYNLTSTFECSNDGTNWVACPMQNVASVPLAENTSVTGGSNGIFAAVVNFKWFRSRISAYTSGTINTILILSPVPKSLPTQPVAAMQDGSWVVSMQNDYPSGYTALSASSGNVANSSAAATLAGTVGKTTYISGFSVTGGGATAASLISVTVAGLLGGTKTYTFAVPAGATTGCTPLVVEFSKPIPASATNTAIVVTAPAFGAGNTNATVNAHGYNM